MLNGLTYGMVGSSGLSDVVSFFNNTSTSGDVSGALGSASIAFKVALFLIMFIGAIAMAIWMARIAIDILLLVTQGTPVGNNEKLQKFGTGEAGNYKNVKSYLGGNIIEIVLVIVLIAFLMTGWLFRLIALALSGFGALGNKLLGLDLEGALTSIDADAFKGGVEARRSASLKIQYDEELGNLRSEAARMYEIAKDGKVLNNPKYEKGKKMYTTYMVRAHILSEELRKDGRDAGAEFKVPEDYFKQHLRSRGDGVCNESFYSPSVLDAFSVTANQMACGDTVGLPGT